MNELDSELVRGQLSTLGYTFTDNPDAAQVVLFNTCSVREHAESKVYSRLGIVSERKLAGENILLGVLGCMAERDGLSLLQRFPQLDIMCGPGELDKLPALIDAARRSEAATAAERTALAGNRTRRTRVREHFRQARPQKPSQVGHKRHHAHQLCCRLAGCIELRFR